MIRKYLARAGIENPSVARMAGGILKEELSRLEKIGGEVEGSPAGGTDLYTYKVPALNKDGTCCIDKLDKTPYDLAPLLGGRNDSNWRFLEKLRMLLSGANLSVNAGWMGVYKTFDAGTPESRLIKLSYIGIPSRAEFPLNEEFARESNNSVVGMTGRAVLIPDVHDYLEKKGGPYYECDWRVKSEACLPVFSTDFSEVIGIIDVESREKGFFDDEKVARLAALCVALGLVLEGGPRGKLAEKVAVKGRKAARA